MSKVCCPTDLKPVASNYERKAQTYYLSGLNDEARSQKNAVLFIPDIYGFHPNAYQLADMMAAEGYTVILPNFFGEFVLDQTKPINRESEEWKNFYDKHVTQFDRHLALVEKTVKFLKNLGAEKIGVLGMCWGSRVAMMAATKWPDMFSAMILPHPSFFDAETGKGVTTPTLLMPSGGESEEIMKLVTVNLKASNPLSEEARFGDLHHGYMGARGYLPGSLSQMPEEYMKRTQESIDVAMAYFKKTLVA